MAENLKRQPKRGILKNSSSFDSNDRNKDEKPATKWDEMNILATLHPADKDYGHMKIEEPKTPYNYAHKETSEDELDGLDANLLAQRMQAGSDDLPRAMVTPPPILEDSEEEISPEEREIRKKFEMKRKKHYNEFEAVKLARKLMEQDTDEEEDGEGGAADGDGVADNVGPSSTGASAPVADSSMEADSPSSTSAEKSSHNEVSMLSADGSPARAESADSSQQPSDPSDMEEAGGGGTAV